MLGSLAGYVSTLFVLDTPCAGHENPREVAKRQLAGLPHGNLTPPPF